MSSDNSEVIAYVAKITDTDETLAGLSHITHLYCICNKNFTDAGLAPLINLTHLECCYYNFTDKGISRLTNLTYLGFGYNENFTEDALKNITTE
jgi:Leucine-rich repeat (LRR) protein